MTGLLINAVPKTSFDLGGLFQNSTTVSLQIPLAGPIDALDFIDAYLVVRVHQLTITNDGDLISVGLYSDGFLDSQTGAMAITSFARVDIDNESMAPALLIAGAPVVGTYVAVGISGTRISTPPSTIAATISVDVLLRGPDATPLDLVREVLAR